MTDPCRVSLDELRHDEDEMNRAKYDQPITVEELIGNLKDMEPVGEGLCYLTKGQEEELLAAIRIRDLAEIGRIVITGTANYLTMGIVSGQYTREGE